MICHTCIWLSLVGLRLPLMSLFWVYFMLVLFRDCYRRVFSDSTALILFYRNWLSSRSFLIVNALSAKSTLSLSLSYVKPSMLRTIYIPSRAPALKTSFCLASSPFYPSILSIESLSRAILSRLALIASSILPYNYQFP